MNRTQRRRYHYLLDQQLDDNLSTAELFELDRLMRRAAAPVDPHLTILGLRMAIATFTSPTGVLDRTRTWNDSHSFRAAASLTPVDGGTAGSSRSTCRVSCTVQT